ncbi:MAG: DNA (cytosine-5-)-methyltransferase [Muricomes sp.]
MGITFIDLFAGIGGFRRGMELAGHKCVGVCEFDKFAIASYISMHLATDAQRDYLSTLSLKQRQKEILKEEYRNGEWYADDIRAVDARSLPQADCWCFGAPCQDFSVAGNRAGLDGDKSSLVREVFRILGEIEEESRPEWLIYENVKGMLSSNKGFDFLEILLAMDELGYDCEWQLFNSKDWGVPQNRERVYTIGHLRRYGPRKILPITGTDGEDSVQIKQIGHQISHRKNPNQYRVYGTEGISPCLNKMDGGGLEPHIAIICKTNPSGNGMNGNVYDGTLINPALTTNKGEGNKIAIPVLTPDGAEKRQNGRRFKDNGEPMFTLTSQDRHGVGIKVKEATKRGFAVASEGDSINLSVPDSKTRRGRVGHGIANTLDTSCNQGIFVQVSDELTVYAIWYEEYQCYIAIRKLTPKECFRLQGWTDDYFDKAAFVNSDSQLYKQAGNGVTVNVVQAIAEKLN